MRKLFGTPNISTVLPSSYSCYPLYELLYGNSKADVKKEATIAANFVNMNVIANRPLNVLEILAGRSSPYKKHFQKKCRATTSYYETDAVSIENPDLKIALEHLTRTYLRATKIPLPDVILSFFYAAYSIVDSNEAFSLNQFKTCMEAVQHVAKPGTYFLLAYDSNIESKLPEILETGVETYMHDEIKAILKEFDLDPKSEEYQMAVLTKIEYNRLNQVATTKLTCQIKGSVTRKIQEIKIHKMMQKFHSERDLIRLVEDVGFFFQGFVNKTGSIRPPTITDGKELLESNLFLAFRCP